MLLRPRNFLFAKSVFNTLRGYDHSQRTRTNYELAIKTVFARKKGLENWVRIVLQLAIKTVQRTQNSFKSYLVPEAHLSTR